MSLLFPFSLSPHGHSDRRCPCPRHCFVFVYHLVLSRSLSLALSPLNPPSLRTLFLQLASCIVSLFSPRTICKDTSLLQLPHSLLSFLLSLSAQEGDLLSCLPPLDLILLPPVAIKIYPSCLLHRQTETVGIVLTAGIVQISMVRRNFNGSGDRSRRVFC